MSIPLSPLEAPPRVQALARGAALIPVWRNGTSAVFRIDHSRRAAALLPTDLYGPAGKRIKRPARDS